MNRHFPSATSNQEASGHAVFLSHVQLLSGWRSCDVNRNRASPPCLNIIIIIMQFTVCDRYPPDSLHLNHDITSFFRTNVISPIFTRLRCNGEHKHPQSFASAHWACASQSHPQKEPCCPIRCSLCAAKPAGSTVYTSSTSCRLGRYHGNQRTARGLRGVTYPSLPLSGAFVEQVDGTLVTWTTRTQSSDNRQNHR